MPELEKAVFRHLVICPFGLSVESEASAMDWMRDTETWLAVPLFTSRAIFRMEWRTLPSAAFP